MSDPANLVEMTLTRLRRLAQGNGVRVDSIQLIDQSEQIYHVPGTLRLSPLFETKSRSYAGPVKGKNRLVLSNFPALAAHLAKERETFGKGGSWLAEAIREIEQDSAHGWGHEESVVTVPSSSRIVAASEPCPSCRATGMMICPQCQGQKHIICPYCHGQKEEECYNCFGKGQDPANPSHACPICHGRKFAPCRYCQGTGMMPCPTCQGRGGTPCNDCKGTGKISQEIQITAGATVRFELAPMPDFPSGLLRMMDRLGLANLIKGHADISLLPKTADDEDLTRLSLEARVPYAEMKLRLLDKACLVIAFGKKGILSGVPPFLDRALAGRIKALDAAARGHGPMEPALSARAISEALRLYLQGKTTPQDLLRLYPVGMSADTAKAIMIRLSHALRHHTAKARFGGAIIANAINAALFGGLYFTGWRNEWTATWPQAGRMGLDIAAPLAALGLGWLVMDQASRRALRRRYPDLNVKGSQDIGKIGYAALAVTLASYALIRMMTGW